MVQICGGLPEVDISMQPYVVEYGTLWALETDNGLPPACPARVAVEFAEVERDDVEALAAAMALSSPEPIRQRLQSNRRCFCLKADGRILSYGWVTRGVEHVGELERRFNLQEDEVYIWDCGTIPQWRGRRLYSALLSQMIYQLRGEDITRIWIGASRHNRPSVRGFVNAGFRRVLDCTYRRFFRLTFLWTRSASSARSPLISAAYRIIVNAHERRLGPMVIGYFGQRQAERGKGDGPMRGDDGV